MSVLNQYALSQLLGSKMSPVKSAQFGNLALLETTAESLKARHACQTSEIETKFTYSEDKVIVRAFEDVRRGSAPDAILWNKVLAREFYLRCRSLGIAAPDATLGRRLINVRKNKARYARHGIAIAPTTVRDPHPSILPQFAHVIEFALVRLRFRYGASIDDILMDPGLGRSFEELALAIAPQISHQDLRLGALSLRKTRFLKKDEFGLADLDVAAIERAGSVPTGLDCTEIDQIPESPGLIELRESGRFLYIARNDNLRPTIAEFQSGRAFAIMANSFWTPDLASISLQYVVGDEYSGICMSKWERRLIYDHTPIFNWPMHRRAA